MSPPPVVDVAEEVRVLMARRRISQQVVADRIGISQSSMSRKLAGASKWTLDEIRLLAALFDVDPAIFLGRAS